MNVALISVVLFLPSPESFVWQVTAEARDLAAFQSSYRLKDDEQDNITAEAMRFAPPLVVWQCRKWNLEYQQALCNAVRPLRLCDPKCGFAIRERVAWYDDAICETHDLYVVWDCVDDLWRKTTIETRRTALQKLMTLLGDEAFDKGELPPPVPLWRFRLRE